MQDHIAHGEKCMHRKCRIGIEWPDCIRWKIKDQYKPQSRCWRVWGTPANFNGFRVFSALLHGIPVTGASQTLQRWTEGATYIQQDGHDVGHWPIFLVEFKRQHASVATHTFPAGPAFSASVRGIGLKSVHVPFPPDANLWYKTSKNVRDACDKVYFIVVLHADKVSS